MTGRRVTRTCVGCRSRADKSDLLRVVAVVDTSQLATEPKGAGRAGQVVPDVRGRLPGRGAYLHRDRGCLDLAERRRAFTRALRLAAPPDLTALHRWFDEQRLSRRPTGTGATGLTRRSTT
ncbi:MAG TPA: YlxR family protein [Jiangellaceae bacterium]